MSYRTYIILYEKNENLEEATVIVSKQVQDAQRDGWRLSGGVSVASAIENGTPCFVVSQSMEKETPIEMDTSGESTNNQQLQQHSTISLVAKWLAATQHPSVHEAFLREFPLSREKES